MFLPFLYVRRQACSSGLSWNFPNNNLLVASTFYVFRNTSIWVYSWIGSFCPNLIIDMVDSVSGGIFPSYMIVVCLLEEQSSIFILLNSFNIQSCIWIWLEENSHFCDTVLWGTLGFAVDLYSNFWTFLRFSYTHLPENILVHLGSVKIKWYWHD